MSRKKGQIMENREESSATLERLAAEGMHSFPTWDALCSGVLATALQCLPGDDSFLARYEQGAEWMTIVASGHAFTQSFAMRAARQIPALRLDDQNAGVVRVSAEAMDYAAQAWLHSAFPAATC